MAGVANITGKIAFILGAHANDKNPEINFKMENLAYGPLGVHHLEWGSAVTDEDILYGTITDAKVVFIRSYQGGGIVKVNGGTGIQIDPPPTDEDGGWFIFANPSGGITSLTVTTTGAAKFEAMLFQ